MTDATHLTDATTLTLDSAINHASITGDTSDFEVSRWSKKGDRLYLSGPAKYDKHSVYLDLETHELHADPKKHEATVTIDADGTATIEIYDNRDDRDHATYVLDTDLEADDAEADVDEDADEADADTDEEETHECEECGDEFDSERGLSIHEGMVHADDESDEADETADADDTEEDVDGESCEVCGGDADTVDVVSGGPICKSCAQDGAETLLADGGEDDPTAEPLEGYEPETTGDIAEATIRRASRGDGGYASDSADPSLTQIIAETTVAAGGRIARSFSPSTQNEGYARERTWTVYAPARNPFALASELTERVLERHAETAVDVYVSDQTGRDDLESLMHSRIGHLFEDDEEALYGEYLRELRWGRGLDRDDRSALRENPSEGRRRVEERPQPDRGLFGGEEGEVGEDPLNDRTRKRLRRLGEWPGDALDYHRITVRVHEDADSPYYG